MRAVLAVATVCSVVRACPGRVGAPCEAAPECRSAPEPECRDWPDGYCTGRCDRDRDCGVLGACIEADDGRGLCLLRCEPARGCRDGYACRGTMDGWNVCRPP